MDLSKVLDTIQAADCKIKEINGELQKLRLSVTALDELENGGRIEIAVYSKDDSILRFTEIFDAAEFEKYATETLVDTAKQSKARLMKAIGVSDPDQEDTTVKELTELTASKKSTVIERHKVDRRLLSELYFKQGKAAKEIAKETGLGESTVFKHISEMKAEKETAAKECVSSGKRK